jgi:hypothetical protein
MYRAIIFYIETDRKHNCFHAVLVRSFWEQDKINEAVEAVNDMEQRGVVGAASVYYELACCLCNNGRWRDAMLQVCSYACYTFICQTTHYASLSFKSYIIFLVKFYFMNHYFVHMTISKSGKGKNHLLVISV